MTEDDGFEEIERDRPGSKLHPCSMVCALVGQGALDRRAKRVSITFRVPLLDPDVQTVLAKANRFNVAYSLSARAIRIRAADDGRFELSKAPKTDTTFLLRFPFPKTGMEWCSVRTPVEPDANPEQGTIILDLPDVFRPKPPSRPSLPPPAPVRMLAAPVPVRDVTAGLMGDPPPGRSALAARHETYEDDKRMREFLGCTDEFPRRLGGVRISPQEGCMLEALLRRDRINRQGFLAATHDPEKGEDDRGSNIVDVLLSKLRKKTADMGFEITNAGSDGWRLLQPAKERLQFLLGEEDAT